MTHGGEKWVALIHGVHNLSPGSTVSLWLDASHVYLFGTDGRIVLPAAYADAA